MWVVLSLIFCAELAFIFAVPAIKLPGHPEWWIAVGLPIAIGWYLYRQYAHGPRDWDRVNHFELRDGKIAFIPSRRMRQMGYESAGASFPMDAGVEFHIETGDRYLTGDHGQCLNRSIWVVQPTGTKQKLLDFAVEVNPRMMADNLSRCGIPLRVIKIYDGQDGQHVETDVTGTYMQPAKKARARRPLSILLGTSSLWLGLLAGFSFHRLEYVIAIGLAGFAVMSILALRSAGSKRAALIQLLTTIPSYAAGYAFAVIAAWYLFRG